jgi:hypothetical protein
VSADQDPLVSIGVAPTQVVAEMWQEILRQEGIPTVLRTSDGYAYLGASAPCMVLTPASHAARGRDLLAQWTPDPDADEPREGDR